jgi:putative transcriptional regulator
MNETITGEELGQKLLQSVKEMKAGKVGRVYHVELSAIAKARNLTGFSPAKFAELFGVSEHTLNDWEQGGIELNGAAHSLLKIAEKRPYVLRDIF